MAVLNSNADHTGKRYQHLYVQVLIAIAVGILLGHFYRLWVNR